MLQIYQLVSWMLWTFLKNPILASNVSKSWDCLSYTKEWYHLTLVAQGALPTWRITYLTPCLFSCTNKSLVTENQGTEQMGCQGHEHASTKAKDRTTSSNWKVQQIRFLLNWIKVLLFWGNILLFTLLYNVNACCFSLQVSGIWVLSSAIK